MTGKRPLYFDLKRPKCYIDTRIKLEEERL